MPVTDRSSCLVTNLHIYIISDYLHKTTCWQWLECMWVPLGKWYFMGSMLLSMVKLLLLQVWVLGLRCLSRWDIHENITITINTFLFTGCNWTCDLATSRSKQKVIIITNFWAGLLNVFHIVFLYHIIYLLKYLIIW